MKKAALIILVVLVALAAALAFGVGPILAHRAGNSAKIHLEAVAGAAPVSPDWRFRVPPPVQKWLAQALPQTGPLPSRAGLSQTGAYKPWGKNRWLAFSARQNITANPAGIVFWAKMPVAPGLAVFGLDTLMAGRGTNTARLCGLWPLVNLDGPEVDISNLTRWAGEAVWLPSGLLPRAGLSWRPGPEENSAVVSIDLAGDDGRGLTANGVFHFDKNGLPASFVSHDRWRHENGRYIKQDWQMDYSHYAQRGPCLVPTRAAVSWLTPTGKFTYARLEINTASYK